MTKGSIPIKKPQLVLILEKLFFSLRAVKVLLSGCGRSVLDDGCLCGCWRPHPIVSDDDEDDVSVSFSMKSSQTKRSLFNVKLQRRTADVFPQSAAPSSALLLFLIENSLGSLSIESLFFFFNCINKPGSIKRT